jgi:hypothetical protein
MAKKTKAKSTNKVAATKRKTTASATKAATSKKAKARKLVAWTKSDLAELRKHSKAKTPIGRIAKVMKRTPGALRQKARLLGVKLGERR